MPTRSWSGRSRRLEVSACRSEQCAAKEGTVNALAAGARRLPLYNITVRVPWC